MEVIIHILSFLPMRLKQQLRLQGRVMQHCIDSCMKHVVVYIGTDKKFLSRMRARHFKCAQKLTVLGTIYGGHARWLNATLQQNPNIRSVRILPLEEGKSSIGTLNKNYMKSCYTLQSKVDCLDLTLVHFWSNNSVTNWTLANHDLVQRYKLRTRNLPTLEAAVASMFPKPEDQQKIVAVDLRRLPHSRPSMAGYTLFMPGDTFYRSGVTFHYLGLRSLHFLGNLTNLSIIKTDTADTSLAVAKHIATRAPWKPIILHLTVRGHCHYVEETLQAIENIIETLEGHPICIKLIDDKGQVLRAKNMQDVEHYLRRTQPTEQAATCLQRIKNFQ